MRPAILELVVKPEDFNKGLIGILLLHQWVSNSAIHTRKIACLRVLTRDFDVVKFTVLELDKVVTEDVQRLKSGSSIEMSFVLVSPSLETLNVFRKSWFAEQEVLFIVFL